MASLGYIQPRYPKFAVQLTSSRAIAILLNAGLIIMTDTGFETTSEHSFQMFGTTSFKKALNGKTITGAKMLRKLGTSARNDGLLDHTFQRRTKRSMLGQRGIGCVW